MSLSSTSEQRMPVVLITRPAGQHAAFAAQCVELGFRVALLPCLEILPTGTAAHALTQLHEQHDTVLFTSANAVHHAHAIRAFPWPAIDVHAIGSATARVLGDYGQSLALIPQAPFNSESYLTQLRGRLPSSLAIVKGVGGRTLIIDHLQNQGIKVQTIDVYQRHKTCPHSDTVDHVFSEGPDIICVTSDEILTNLMQICTAYTDRLLSTALVVNSRRCANLATDLGFDSSRIAIAEPAGDTGQIRCLREWIHTACPHSAR